MKVFFLIPFFLILNNCSYFLKKSEHLFNKTNLDSLVKLELKRGDFLFTNFIDQSDTISIRCFDIMNESGLSGLPIKISWTHRSGSITILSDENGFINFKPEISFSNNSNQVLKFQIDYNYLKLGENLLSENIIETNVKTIGPEAFLDFKLNILQGTTIEKKLEDTFKSFFKEKYFVTFKDQRTSADIVIKILVNIKEKEMPKDGMPFIQYISSDIKIINAKNDNILFEFAIPEIRGGDFDQRKKASKKAIKNLIKHIKTTNFLEN